MKTIKKSFLLVMLLSPLFLMAQSDVDVSNPLSIVAYLAPFIVFLVTQIVKWIKPLLPSWILGVIVPGLSLAVAYLMGLAENPELAFLPQFLLGLASTFVHQLYKQLTSA